VTNLGTGVRRLIARFRLGRTWRVTASVTAADLVPDHLPRRRAFIVTNDVGPSWIAFDCPCGRGHRIMLNLSSQRRPKWQVTDPKRLAIRPSIDSFDGGARCHFWLRDGRVEWAHDAERYD